MVVGQRVCRGAQSSELEVTRASTEGAEATGDDSDEGQRPRVPDELPDSADATCTLRGRADTTTESDSGEGLQTESIDNKHAPRRAQCEMEHRAGVRAVPMTKPAGTQW